MDAGLLENIPSGLFVMTFDEAKDEVLAMHPTQFNAARIASLANRTTAAAGFVMWDASPPAHVPWIQHKESFADAIYLALGFCLGNCRQEWVALGRVGVLNIRSLRQFQQVEGVVCWPSYLVYIGKLGIVDVYMHKEIPSTEFMAGILDGPQDDAHKCCRGQIQHAPVAFGVHEEVRAAAAVPRGAELWRALHGALNAAPPAQVAADDEANMNMEPHIPAAAMLYDADEDPNEENDALAQLAQMPDYFIDPNTFERRPVRRLPRGTVAELP